MLLILTLDALLMEMVFGLQDVMKIIQIVQEAVFGTQQTVKAGLNLTLPTDIFPILHTVTEFGSLERTMVTRITLLDYGTQQTVRVGFNLMLRQENLDM